uniref:Activating transcription factor 7-interacting protein 1 n=1 Tax=Magallana gigas TaxID=29159 RepID=K1Q3G1_MAGGI
MVKTKVLNHLKTQKDGIVAELQQKVEELQASNDGWKQRVKELEKQILEVTVLQQKHEKRKAKTAALRQITTKNVGVQVDSQRAAAAIGQLQQQQVQQTTPVKSPTPRPASRTPTTTTVQTPPTTKQGPVLNITKSTSASPQLVPPRSTLNPVPNIPILKTQTTAQSQTGYVSQTAPVVALATSPANTADNSKGPFPSNQTVKSILDNSRGQIAQPTGNSRVRPVRAMTPATQINTIISPPTIPNQMTSFIVVPTPAPIPNTKQNVSVVTTPVVNQPIQQAQQSQQVQTKSVKVIDLTMEEEANRNLANRGVALSMSQNQVLVPTGQGLPQGLILGNPATSILRNGQQPAYQIVFSSTSQPVRLTYAAPVPNTSMRPAVAGTTVVASTSQTIAAMPQLRPGQAVGSPANPRQPLPVTSAQQRPPPPLQYGAQGANRVANTSLTTVAPPPLAPQHPAPLPSITSAVAPGQKPLPPKPSLKISRVSQGIVLSWNMTLNETPHADIASYQLFAYQEGTSTPSTTLWKKVGDVKALPLPMACTLTQFQEGNKYHFAVRPVDVLGRNEIAAVFNARPLTWTEASSNCSLLGPNIQTELTTAKISTQGVHVKGWIGAYKGSTAWLNIKGCYRVNTSDLYSVRRSRLHSKYQIGRCTEDCTNSTIYGLSEGLCFCFTSFPALLSKCTARLCNGSTSDFCGGPVNSGSQSTTDIMFYTQSTYVEVLYTVSSRVNWTEAVLSCGKHGYTIADTYSFNNFLQEERLILFWVGIFRREFIKIDTAIPYNPHVSTLCTAASVLQDGTLQLSYENCTQKLPSWCEVSKNPITTRPHKTGRGNLVTIFMSLALLGTIAVIVIVTIFFLRKRIAREVRKAWIHSKNYSAHKNSLTGSIGHTKTPTDAPQQNNDEYDHTVLSPNTTDRGPGYASVHLGNSGQDPSSSRINSTYDHLSRQSPQTHATSIYDHSSYKQNIVQTDDVIQTADDYDHIDRRVQKTKDSLLAEMRSQLCQRFLMLLTSFLYFFMSLFQCGVVLKECMAIGMKVSPCTQVIVMVLTLGLLCEVHAQNYHFSNGWQPGKRSYRGCTVRPEIRSILFKIIEEKTGVDAREVGVVTATKAFLRSSHGV